MNPTSRRRFLSSVGATAALGLAGCTGNSQISNLKSRLGAANEREQRLQEKLDQTQAELNETQTELDRVETQRDELRTQLHTERQKTKELQTQLDQQNETISTLETRVEQKEQRITELESLVGTTDHGYSKDIIKKAEALGNEVQKSVALVEMYQGSTIVGNGTAWHLGKGYYLTNRHIATAGDSLTLTLFDEDPNDGRTVSAELLGRTHAHRAPDIALLKGDSASPPALEYKDQTNLKQGDPLIHVGHPMGVGEWIIGLGPFQHYGITTNKDSSASKFNSYLPSRNGNSGSPTLTLDGKVVGMTYGSSSTKDDRVHAPDFIHQTYASYPLPTNHVHSNRFDHYINKWK